MQMPHIFKTCFFYMRNISIRYLGPFISPSLVLMVPLKAHNTSDTVCICSSLDSIGSNHGHSKKKGTYSNWVLNSFGLFSATTFQLIFLEARLYFVLLRSLTLKEQTDEK